MGEMVLRTEKGGYKEAQEKKAAVERLNCTVGAKNRELEIKPMKNSDGKFYVEERFKK